MEFDREKIKKIGDYAISDVAKHSIRMLARELVTERRRGRELEEIRIALTEIIERQSESLSGQAVRYVVVIGALHEMEDNEVVKRQNDQAPAEVKNSLIDYLENSGLLIASFLAFMEHHKGKSETNPMTVQPKGRRPN